MDGGTECGRSGRVTLKNEAGQKLRVIMELDIVDQLLVCLVDQPRNGPMAMHDLGYTQDQISAAWREAKGSATPNPPDSGRIG